MDRVLGNTRRPFRQHRQPLHGFTLIELLVVVAIIIALLAILMPSMNRALFVSQETVCASNFRQKGAAIIDLATDDLGAFPTGQFAGGIGLNPWGYHDGFLKQLADRGAGWEMWFCPLVPHDSFWTHNTNYNVPMAEVADNDSDAIADYMRAHSFPANNLTIGQFNYYVPRQASSGFTPHNGVGGTRQIGQFDEWPTRVSNLGTGGLPLISDIVYTFPSDPMFKESAHRGHEFAGKVESLNAVWPDGSVRRRSFEEFELRQDHHYGIFF